MMNCYLVRFIGGELYIRQENVSWVEDLGILEQLHLGLRKWGVFLSWETTCRIETWLIFLSLPFGLENVCLGLNHAMAPQAWDALNARGRYGHWSTEKTLQNYLLGIHSTSNLIIYCLDRNPKISWNSQHWPWLRWPFHFLHPNITNSLSL